MQILQNDMRIFTKLNFLKASPLLLYFHLLESFLSKIDGSVILRVSVFPPIKLHKKLKQRIRYLVVCMVLFSLLSVLLLFFK